jgi:DNA-damage-inducible protein J
MTQTIYTVPAPNALTAETLEKSERGEDVHRAKDAADLFHRLGI